MHNKSLSDPQLAITPLGAGDLIDRSVRVYRKNFATFFLIAAPPVLSATLFSVFWTLFVRWLFPMGIGADGFSYIAYILLSWVGGMMVTILEFIAMMTIMGGASRNFVRNLLFGEPISFKETYRNVKGRLAALILASFLIIVIIGLVTTIVFYIWMMVIVFGISILSFIFASFPTILAIVSILLTVVSSIGAVAVFFIVTSRLVYIPQAMLVENKGVFASFGRSVSLARGNVKRVSALVIFTGLATYSAIAILYVPLLWISLAQGVNLFGGDGMVPAWYEITSQLIGQISIILLAPVWMAGLCLLYVDERVRHEGYDIELMAAQRLGDIPAVPKEYFNPLQPALATEVSGTSGAANDNSKLTVVNLK